MLSRRDTTRLLFCAAAALALPRSVPAATPEEWRSAMSDALQSATVPDAGTTLALADFTVETGASAVGMVALVEMTWMPGQRKRLFRVSAASEREAFVRLVGDIVTEFRAANPDGLREVRLSQ